VKTKPQIKYEEEILSHPTCAIWGDDDTFTSSKKLKSWAAECQQKSQADFTAFEVVGTGHFWIQSDSERQLRDSLRSWITKIE
jgi:surfactin synthase thioesterase subunit